MYTDNVINKSHYDLVRFTIYLLSSFYLTYKIDSENLLIVIPLILLYSISLYLVGIISTIIYVYLHGIVYDFT